MTAPTPAEVEALIADAISNERNKFAKILQRLIDSAERDDMLSICESCGAPFWADEDGATTVADITGCWFAATQIEKYRPDWCLDRADLVRRAASQVVPNA